MGRVLSVVVVDGVSSLSVGRVACVGSVVLSSPNGSLYSVVVVESLSSVGSVTAADAVVSVVAAVGSVVEPVTFSSSVNGSVVVMVI